MGVFERIKTPSKSWSCATLLFLLPATMADPPSSVEAILNEYPKHDTPKPGQQLDFMLSDDPQFDRLKEYARNLPYQIESNASMQRLLDFILKRCLLNNF